MLEKFKRYYNVDNLETAPPPPTEECYSYQLISYEEENIVFNYTPCGGISTSVTLNNESLTVCAESVTPPGGLGQGTKWDIFIGDQCGI
jgi:hypothetical protein